MNCIYCRGNMEKGVAPFQINREGYHITLDAVPAWICTQCGETFFEPQEVDRIQELIRSVDESTKRLATST